MASFLSTFSIFFLVLLNGFFAIPINKQQNSSSSFFDHSTAEFELNTRSIPVDATSPLVDFEHEHAFSEHMASNTSYPFYNLTEEHTGQGLRGLQELLNSSALESTTEALTHVLRSLNVGFDNDTDTEQDERAMPIEKTTAWTRFSTSSPSRKSQQLSTSKQSTVQGSETKPQYVVKPKRKLDVEPKPKGDSESEQREDEPHPHPHPHPEHEHEHVEKKAVESLPSEGETASESEATPKKTSRMPLYDDPRADNAKEPTAPTAYFDQDASQNVTYPLNNALYLDDNNNLNVTNIPRRFSSSTMKSSEEAKLNQGKKPLHAEEEESNH